jgi:hypothetical protein
MIIQVVYLLSGSELGLSGSIAIYRLPRALTEIQRITFRCLSTSIAGKSTTNGAFATQDRRAWEIVEIPVGGESRG